MALYTLKSQQDMAKMLSAPKYNPNSQNVYNAIGRDAGTDAGSSNTSVWDNIGNFFKNRASDIENAFGTTGAAIASKVATDNENRAIEERQERWKKRLADVGKKYGFESTNDYWDKLDAAEASGNTEEYNRLNSMTDLQDEIKKVAAENAAEAKQASDNWRDFRENNYVGKKIEGQTNGQFAGSAINTLSTAADLTGLSVGPVGNAIQGAAEGLAEELKANGGNLDVFRGEASGWDNFSGERAAKNAIVGAATGAATGALNKAINGKMLANGGNLFKGGNKLTQALNNAGSKTALGRVVSTIATGAGRGALSGAVGGATGAAVSSALNGEDVGTGISNALQGASNGIATGGILGGTMAGANMVANKLPGVNKITNLQKQSSKAVDDFQNSGDNFRERLSNTWNSGDSKVANMAQNWQSGGDNFRERLATTMDSFKTNSPAHFTQKNWGLDNVPEAEVTTPEPARIAQPATSTAEPLDNWDKIAREGGYENWDALEQRFMEANPNYKPTGNDAGAVLGWMDNNPGDYNPNARITQTAVNEESELAKVPTSKQIKGKRQMVEEITSQFNPPDKPTVRATKPTETFSNLYEEWGLSDGDDIRHAVSYAKQGALIPQMVREAAGEVGVIDLTDAQALVMDLKLNKQASSRVINALEQVMDSTDSTIFGGKQGVDALELQRDLQQIASDARGTNGTYRIGNSFVDETMARNFDRIANNIGQKLDEAAIQKSVVPNILNRHAQDIQNMKSAFPDNAKWQEAIDTKILGAQNIGDLRHSMKDLVRANIFITNGDENFNTVGGRYAAANATIPTTKAGIENRIVNDIWDKIRGSKVARNARLDKSVAMMNGESDTKATTPTTTSAVTTPASTASNNTIPPSMMLYNAIGRDNGKAANQFVLNGGSITPTASTTLEELSFSNPGSTSVYDSYSGAPTTNTAYTGADLTQAGLLGIFGNTGNYNMDIIGGAMEMALMRGDSASFNELSSIYKMLGANLADSTASNTNTTKLTTTQQRANAAMTSLQRLASMTPDAGYNLSNIPVVGNIATLGGNDYEGEAKSLAQQIGYMVSGANIKPEEAYNIGKAYVPQPFDNERTRELKLQRAYEIILQYQNGISSSDNTSQTVL